jgi:hypothetical protein
MYHNIFTNEKIKERTHTSGSCIINSWALAILAAFWTSSSVASGFPNRILSSIDPVKRTGSWLTIPICERSQATFKLLISFPSSKIRPSSGS